ncbi:hypothetical protein BDV06DRAFT_184199 [Aspergillus oleicola]
MNAATRLSRGLRALPTAPPQPSLPRASPRFYSQLSLRQHRPSLQTQTYLHKPTTTRITLPSTSTITRYNSNSSDKPSPSPSPLTDRPSNPDTDTANAEQNRLRREQEPAYQLTFTCNPCGERSTHRVSKHGYHRGTVLIRCPGCDNRHVISDHLKIFFNHSMTLDDLLKQQGQKVTRGELQGDVEFWEDGTVVKQEKSE